MRRIGCLGLIAGLLVIAGLFAVMQSWGGAGPARTPLTVTIPQGASLSAAAVALEKAGAIPSAGRSPGVAGRRPQWTSDQARS